MPQVRPLCIRLLVFMEKEFFTEQIHINELLRLLNWVVKECLTDDGLEPITYDDLVYFANIEDSMNVRYRYFSIRKKSGGLRKIHSPNRGLMPILKALSFILQRTVKLHESAMGFVLNKSIVENAKKHQGQNFVFNIDLKDFFYSFDKEKVKTAFMNEPFCLRDEKEPVAELLSEICTHPIKVGGRFKQVLPQGSPASPILSNILFYQLDQHLSMLAEKYQANYSRYADDITFSSTRNIFTNKHGNIESNFISELKKILAKGGFKINPKKIRLQKKTSRQVVTGLVVNQKINVHRNFIKQIRMWLYYWERYGYPKAQSIFFCDYKEKTKNKKNKKRKVSISDGNYYGVCCWDFETGYYYYVDAETELMDVLRGKLSFLKMVKGKNDTTYLKLKERFDNLCAKTKENNFNCPKNNNVD